MAKNSFVAEVTFKSEYFNDVNFSELITQKFFDGYVFSND